MSMAVLLAGLAGVCAVLAVWELIAAAEQVRLVRGLARWLAPLDERAREILALRYAAWPDPLSSVRPL